MNLTTHMDKATVRCENGYIWERENVVMSLSHWSITCIFTCKKWEGWLLEWFQQLLYSSAITAFVLLRIWHFNNCIPFVASCWRQSNRWRDDIKQQQPPAMLNQYLRLLPLSLHPYPIIFLKKFLFYFKL